jgi:hypothetical protein
MQETFTTTLHTSRSEREVSIYNLPHFLEIEDKDTDVYYTAKVKVHWTFGISDAREWGISDLLFRIDKVCVDIDWKYPIYDTKDNLIDTKEGNIDMQIVEDFHKENNPNGWDIKNEMKLSLHTICPNDVEIDFQQKTIIVS